MTNNKWQQWKNKNLTHDDSEERKMICDHLKNETDYRNHDILNNYFMKINMTYGNICAPSSIMPSYAGGYKMYRPDVAVWTHPKKLEVLGDLKFVVEIDGAAHRKGGESKRTSRRNQDYKDVGIVCLIVDRDDCKMLGITYTERLDQLLVKYAKKIEKATRYGKEITALP